MSRNSGAIGSTSHNTCSFEYVNSRNSDVESDTFPPEIINRFWAKVRRGESAECWLWTAYKFGSMGYGGFALKRAGGKYAPEYAHRISWALANGPIPSGQSVLHSCDVPACVNPAHLFLGTQRTNMQDAASKGQLHTPRPNKQTVTDEQVAAIKAMVIAGASQADAARTFGVTKGYVCLLLQGKRRQHKPLTEHATGVNAHV